MSVSTDIKMLSENGLTETQIAARLNVLMSVVRQVLNGKARPPALADERFDQDRNRTRALNIRAMGDAGMGGSEIARRLGVTRQAISLFCQTHGIKLPDKRRRRG